MPAVGTPEPGGLSWRELTTLLRRIFERRRVVACDVVELCPIPGMASPNFIAAKLVYKLLTYKFGPNPELVSATVTERRRASGTGSAGPEVFITRLGL